MRVYAPLLVSINALFSLVLGDDRYFYTVYRHHIGRNGKAANRGEITNYDQAMVFPIVSGIEILYFNKDCPAQE